jgi:Domain of unknown function (DUF4352)
VPKYNPPPNWPAPPPGWTPPTGWKAPANWPPPPNGWKFWLPDEKEGSWFGRHKILSTVGGVLAGLALLTTFFSIGDDTPSAVSETSASPTTSAATSIPEKSSSPSTGPAEEEESLPGIGDTVRDGVLEFTVKSMNCGVTQIGDEYLNKEPQGQYCIVTIKVKNASKKPTTWDGDNQTLIDTKDSEYSPDNSAWAYLDANNTLLEEINPGNSVTGRVAWDVPKKTKPDRLLLKEGIFGFSEGVTVSLREPATTKASKTTGSSATFKHFKVTVNRVSGKGSTVNVLAEVCVRRLPPDPQGDRTRISWKPWSIRTS